MIFERERSSAQPRALAVFLCRELTQATWRRIGRAFGARDHSSCIALAYRARYLLAANPKLRARRRAISLSIFPSLVVKI